jgi:recombination protein RecT
VTNAVIPRSDPKAQYQAIENAVRAREADIVATLVPTIPRDRFIAVALQAITRSPRLLQCTPASIIKALRDAAELGLEPSGLMGSAYLVPYRNRKSNTYEAQLIAGYRGLIDLARRSGEVKTIEAHVVRERDEFVFEFGTTAYLRHVPYLNVGDLDENDQPIDAGNFVAAYAFARLTSGEVQFEVMDVPQIEQIRRRSKAADDGPWVTDWAEMARKTPTRRLLKYLPLSAVALTRALELEDAAEGDAIAVTAVAPARAALASALSVPSTDAPTDTPDAQDDEPDAGASSDTTDEQNVDPEPAGEAMSDEEITRLARD